MRSPDDSTPPDACPASAVILATRLAKTPLAVADAHAPDAPILFANDTFAALVGIDADALKGRSLGSLSTSPTLDVARAGTTRFELAVEGATPVAVALSTAAVPGADGAPFCLLCSLVDARGEGADAAIARDAELLVQVAQAAGDLMRESAIAARVGASTDASAIALEAIGHNTNQERA